jgi:hypothetical protein
MFLQDRVSFSKEHHGSVGLMYISHHQIVGVLVILLIEV